MKVYHKIETIYERDLKTKKILIGKYRNSIVEYLKDGKWIFTEKLMGRILEYIMMFTKYILQVGQINI